MDLIFSFRFIIHHSAPQMQLAHTKLEPRKHNKSSEGAKLRPSPWTPRQEGSSLTRAYRPALLGHVPSPLSTGHAGAAGPPQAAGEQRSVVVGISLRRFGLRR